MEERMKPWGCSYYGELREGDTVKVEGYSGYYTAVSSQTLPGSKTDCKFTFVGVSSEGVKAFQKCRIQMIKKAPFKLRTHINVGGLKWHAGGDSLNRRQKRPKITLYMDPKPFPKGD